MSKPASTDATIGDLMARGVDDVEVFCADCGHKWRAPITFLPAATSLGKAAALLTCPTCEGREIEVGWAEAGKRVMH